MAIAILMVRRGAVLSPATGADEAAVLSLPLRTALTATVTKTANPSMKAWYRALLAKLVDSTGMWPTTDEAHKQLLLRCGFGESMVLNGSGDVRFTPPSTVDWDQFEWRAYFDVLIEKLATDIVPGISAADLRREIEASLGMDFAQPREVA